MCKCQAEVRLSSFLNLCKSRKFVKTKTYSFVSIKMKNICQKKKLRKFATSMVCISIYAMSLGLCNPLGGGKKDDSIKYGVAESKAHCINTDANHTSNKFSQFFLADIFHFDANKRIFFCSYKFPTFT